MNQQEIASQLRHPEGETGRHFGEKMNETNLLINQWAIGSLDLQSGEAVLEIGLGNGKYISEVLSLQENIHYTGLDASATMIEEATHLNQELVNQKRIQLVKGSSEQLPFADRSFDKIFTVNTLYFWPSPEKDLAEICRVLKDGGMFCLAFRSKECMEDLPFVQFGFQLYNQEEAVDLLQKNGFKVKKVIYKKDQTESITGKEMEKDAIILCGVKSTLQKD